MNPLVPLTTPPWLATWLLVALACWPIMAAFVVAAVAWSVETRRDQTWESENRLPGNLSEGRDR